MDTDSFILGMKTEKVIKDSKNLEHMFHLSNLHENHGLFSNRNKKIIGKFKIESPKNSWMDEFICL